MTQEVPRIPIRHQPAQEPIIAAAYKMLKAIENASVRYQTDAERWAALDAIRKFVGQRPRQMDDVDYWAMREYIRTWADRMGI